MDSISNKGPNDRMREPRVPLRICVRVKTDFGSEAAEVRNMSSQGIMIAGASPPPRGTYVEISHGSSIVIGRVAWASNDRFGVHLQDRVVLAELLSGNTASLPGAQKRQTGDRGRLSSHRRDSTEVAASSIQFARSFEFVVIVVVTAVAAIALVYAAREILLAPLQKVDAALGG